jgi:antitoxin (DNA-binding transcriptional repressor) of toxin-antitoxin stability system
MIGMTVISATEAARRFSAILDASSRGETFEVMRGGTHVATISPPHHPNGAALIEAYSSIEPDEEFADLLEEVHGEMNKPNMIEDPWADD